MLSSFFTNPWLLYALAAVALPWIIEWLFRRRKRQVELPTLRYLLRNKEQEKIKKQDRILLVLRTVACFFIVTALARPLLQQGWLRGENRRNVVIFLDATASTNQQVGVTTAFELAKKKAFDLVSALPKDTEVTVGYLGEQALGLLEGEKDVHAAAGRIKGLRAGSGAASMDEGFVWIKDYLSRSARSDAELYIFSDFQTYTWKRQGTQAVQAVQTFQELASRCETFLIDVGGTPTFNYLVTDLHPTEKFVTTGMPVRFQVKIEVRGKPPPEAHARVTFVVHDEQSLLRFGDSKGDKKDVREVSPGEQPALVEFEHRFLKPGEYLVEALLEGDEHPDDNRRLFLCTVPDEMKVLILDPAAGSGTEDSFFLSRAIAPPTPSGTDKVSRFAVKTVQPGEIVSENLESYAAVVMVATNPLDPKWAIKLEKYVADGGSAWLFLGPVSLYDYNKLLFRDGKGMLPCRLAEKDPGGSAGPALTLNFASAKPPALSDLSDGNGSKSAEVSKYVPLEPPADGDILLKLSNGSPALVQHRYGRGQVVLFNSTSGVSWTDLPALPEYPILVQELLSYLVGSPDDAVNLKVGDRFEEAVYVSLQHLLLKCPDGRKVRLTPKARKDRENALSISFDQTGRHGLYEFVDVQQEILARKRFVVNASSEEGDLHRIQKSDFRDLYGSGFRDWIGPERNIEDYVSKLHSVTELAPWLLVLLTAVLGFESFLAARFGRRRAEPLP